MEEKKDPRIKEGHAQLIYIEGLRFAGARAVIKSKFDGGVSISVSVPWDPDLFPSRFASTDTVNGGTHENGLEILYDIEMHGIILDTMIHVFDYNLTTKEERFMAEGRVVQVGKRGSGIQTMIVMNARGPEFFMQKIDMQMADQRRSLQLKQEWDDQLGVSSVSSILDTIKSNGLRNGCLKVLDDAGHNTDIYSNRIWRMLKLFHRIQIIDNPKALGLYEGSVMSDILEQRLDDISADAPLTQVINQVMGEVRYHKYPVLCPSFLNAKFDFDSDHPDRKNLNDLEMSVDTESENVDYTIEPISGAAQHLKTNDIIYAPCFFLSPPPRPNVIFPTQYESPEAMQDLTQVPTRGITNISGNAAITSMGDEDALIMPDDIRQGLVGNKYYASPTERAVGITWSKFHTSSPESPDELESDYVKGYQEVAYAMGKYEGNTLRLSGTSYNPKPIVGMPTLILSNDGQHVIGRLAELTHSPDQTGMMKTQYAFDMFRPYNERVPDAPLTYWYRHDMFSQDNVGSYIYPKLIGPLMERRMEGVVTSDIDDLSIMVHLYNDPEIDVADIESVFENPDAPGWAVDILFDLWKNCVDKEWFDRDYGARLPLSMKNWFNTFYSCLNTEDWFAVVGGYTHATNSITTPSSGSVAFVEMTAGEARAKGLAVPDGFPDEVPYSVVNVSEQSYVTSEETTEYGEILPRDQELAGCFMTERQNAYIASAIRVAGSIAVPQEITALIEAAEVPDRYTDVIEEIRNV